MTKKVSIYDVAKYCHVSAASVSYVLNGKKKVSLETKRKILRAIDELGFVMDSSARALSTGRSHLIGLFLPLDDASVAFMQNPFYAELLGGLETGIADYDYDIVIGYQKNQNNFKDWVQSRGIDAIVMLGKYPKSVYEDIKKLHITAVLIDVYEEYGKEFYNIRIHDELGMYKATQYLIENGHTAIGFVGSKEKSLIDLMRYKGYERAMKEHHLLVDESMYFESFATFDEGVRVADEIIKRNNVTAVVCTSDITAIGIMRKYGEEKKSVPEDLSIVGFDDIQVAQYVYPGITTVRQDIRLKGELAAKAIIEDLKKKKSMNTTITLEPSLVIRESVKKVN